MQAILGDDISPRCAVSLGSFGLPGACGSVGRQHCSCSQGSLGSGQTAHLDELWRSNIVLCLRLLWAAMIVWFAAGMPRTDHQGTQSWPAGKAEESTHHVTNLWRQPRGCLSRGKMGADPWSLGALLDDLLHVAVQAMPASASKSRRNSSLMALVLVLACHFQNPYKVTIRSL